MNLKQIAIYGLGASVVTGGVGAGIYLSQDKTIEDKLIREGAILINEVSEFQAVFKVFKNEDELTTAISTAAKAITSRSTEAEGGKELKTWCNEKLRTSLSDEKAKNLITKTKKYCTKAPTTIKEKYIKNGKKLVSDWGTKLDSIKGIDAVNLLTDLKTKDNTISTIDDSSKQKATIAFEKWCTENVTKQLSDGDTGAILTKVEHRCFEE